jgi:hypothetical protein
MGRILEKSPDQGEGSLIKTVYPKMKFPKRLITTSLCSRQPAFYVFNLPVMVRLMLTNVEPFTIIIGRTPWPAFIYLHQPGIIPFFEFGNGNIPYFL